jgi:GNAT superfamily N-acetyltransferase
MSNISKSCNMLDCHFNKGIDEKSELMKKAIKENLMDNSFYANIFEENPIKKSLILKNKQDFTVSVFEKGMTVEDFGDIIKEQYITNEKDLDTYLNFSCGINFIKLERQSDYSFFIVHNNEDVVGVGALANNPFLKELPDSDKFKYLSFIAVNSAYRGHGVGLKISDEIMSHCVEKNYIYERSGASRDGSLYMEKKIDHSSSRYENRLPVIKEHYGETVRLYIKDKFKEGCNYEEERQSLISKVILLKAAEQEKGKLLKGDLKKIFGTPNIHKIKY